MQNILITGGSGYIGSHTLLALARQNKYNLKVFDNFKNGHREAIKRINESTGANISFVEGDLLDFQSIESVIAENEFTAVIHFAALIEAGVSVVHPLRFYENNVVGSLNLFKAMQAHGLRKLVFSSTAAVYGTPIDMLVTENTPCNPENPYGWTKYTVENILHSLDTPEVAPEEKIEHVILRYFNAAGGDPNLLIGQDYPKPTHLITVAIEAALGIRDKLTIFGQDYPTPDGTCIRDYIHVTDLANAHVKALDYLTTTGTSNTFNIGTGKGVSNLEVVKLIEKIHGKFSWELGPRRPGDPAAYYADNTKATNVLGWAPEFDVAQAIQHAYEWKKKYPKGYANI